ncbi:universal stress protein [Rhodanobacter sp. 115]|uniref:universal stress protein n=1 Tax=Rhodanobacter sp. FW021-MT20 TaxID=1162282 RepID=UPI000260DB88|nr:universal stress protein [Rhodanobacter sp. 115]EIL86835.1 Universal stress protein UspA [Rhodanobacter sp. 115]
MLDIIVKVDHAPSHPAWLDGVLALARRQQAFLTGLQVTVACLDTSDTIARSAGDNDDRAHGRRWWLELCRKADVNGEWEVIHTAIPEVFAKRSCLADFGICELRIGAADAPAGLHEVTHTLFAHAVPMLLVPDIFYGNLRTDRIVIAWNGAAEIAHAIQAALPLLTQASEVHVLDGERSGLPGISPPSLPLRTWLQRHNIAAQWHPFPAEHDEGPALLATAKALCADLMVMGAWGRMRAGGPALGGATRWLLEHATLPLFVSR